MFMYNHNITTTNNNNTHVLHFISYQVEVKSSEKYLQHPSISSLLIWSYSSPLLTSVIIIIIFITNNTAHQKHQLHLTVLLLFNEYKMIGLALWLCMTLTLTIINVAYFSTEDPQHNSIKVKYKYKVSKLALHLVACCPTLFSILLKMWLWALQDCWFASWCV